MEIVAERVRVTLSQIRFDSVNRKVHLRKLQRRRVRLLSVDRKTFDAPPAPLDELTRLNEHSPRAATWIVDAPLVGLQNFHKGADDARRGVEFPRVLPFGGRKLRKAIFVHAP